MRRNIFKKLVWMKYPNKFTRNLSDFKPPEFPKTEKEEKKEESGNPEDEDEFYEPNAKKKTFQIFLGAAISVLGLYAVLEVSNLQNKQKSQRKTPKSSSTGKATIGGDWELVDTQGRKLSSNDLKGSYYLLYFGFCNCPDICPASLYKLSKAYDKVLDSNEIFNPLKFVFISVDPDRDTPEKIEKFLNLFSTKILGTTSKTNDSVELKDMMRKFRIYASKIEFEDNEEKFKNAYTIDHTIITYLMDDNNEYLTFLGSNLSEGDIARKIIESINESEKQKIYN